MNAADDRQWAQRREGLNLPVAVGVLGLHLVAALAWQPTQASTPTEVVLKAVLMPTVKPRQEELRPEPPPPQRQVQPQRSSTQASHQNVAAELSDALAEPVFMPQAPAASLTQTGLVRVAMARVAGAAMDISPAESHPSHTPTERAASLHASRTSVAQAVQAAAGAATSQQTHQSVVATPQAGVQPALTSAQTAQAVDRSEPAAANLSQVSTPSLVASPKADSAPAEQRLAAIANPVVGQINRPVSGAATLAERDTVSAQAMPLEQAVKLARAQPGRPVPAVSADGVTESVDYAENNPEFIYPRLAVRMGLEGTVLLQVEVLPDGRPGEVRIQQSSGSDMLDKDALRQLATWRFKPPLRLGRSHSTRVTVPINYRLNSKGRP